MLKLKSVRQLLLGAFFISAFCFFFGVTPTFAEQKVRNMAPKKINQVAKPLDQNLQKDIWFKIDSYMASAKQAATPSPVDVVPNTSIGALVITPPRQAVYGEDGYSSFLLLNCPVEKESILASRLVSPSGFTIPLRSFKFDFGLSTPNLISLDIPLKTDPASANFLEVGFYSLEVFLISGDIIYRNTGSFAIGFRDLSMSLVKYETKDDGIGTTYQLTKNSIKPGSRVYIATSEVTKFVTIVNDTIFVPFVVLAQAAGGNNNGNVSLTIVDQFGFCRTIVIPVLTLPQVPTGN